MNQVIVIGPTYQHEVVYLKTELSATGTNDGAFNYVQGGGAYLMALALAELKTEVNFITRLGNDDTATNLWNTLESRSVTVFSHDIPFPTARRLTIIDAFSSYDVDNIPFEIHPGPEDTLPAFMIERADYGIVNLINSALTTLALNRFPDVHWVAYDYLPSEDLLPKFEGVVLPAETARKMSFSDRYDIAADSILEKGVKWVIVTDDGKGVWLFTDLRKDRIESGYAARNNYYVGCNELFTADLVCLLSRGFNLDVCIQMALKFAAHKLEIPDIIFTRE